MPWTAADAPSHTKLATTRHLKSLWATVANKTLVKTGDDARAIKEANATVRKASGARFI